MRRLALMAALVLATPSAAGQVGETRTYWTGNDIVIKAIADPKVTGCVRATGSRSHRTRPSPADRPAPGPMVIDTIETEDGE